MMTFDSELFYKLEEIQKQDVLVIFYDSVIIEKEDGTCYLLCYLLPVSDESDFLSENESIFWDRSKLDGHYCFNTTGDLLSREINPTFVPEGKSYQAVAEQQKALENACKDKILRIKPYFKYNQVGGYFYRNPDLLNYSIDMIPCAYPCESFFKIPVLSEQNYRLLKEHKTISLQNWNLTVFGVPKYLIYQNHLIFTKLTTSKASEYNCVWKEESDDFVELEFDKKAYQEANLYLPGTEREYAFLEKSLLPLMRKIEPVKPYMKEAEKEETQQEEVSDQTEAALKGFEGYLRSKNLYYFDEDIKNFHACLKSRILTILAGMSGTGKTRLPLEYAEFFGMREEEHTLLFLPISPSYSEPSDILGFYNPSNDTYVPSETGFTSFLIHAQQNPDRMHMVIFDEMNLAQIEYYFAPFLSVLEKDAEHRSITLYDENLNCRNKDQYPSKVRLLDNLLFVGTINLDETTKNLSDRLLDRSFVISLKKATFDRYNGVMSSLTGENELPYSGNYRELMGKVNPTFCFNDVLTAEMREFFDAFDKLLYESDSQKGISYRTVKNITLYLKNFRTDGNEISLGQAFDFAVRQTVMKRIKGNGEILLPLIGTLDEKGQLQDSSILALFHQFSSVSSFELSKQELKNKAIELTKYGYCR